MALTFTQFNNFASHHVTEIVVSETTQFRALWCTKCGAVETELQDHPCQWHQRRTTTMFLGVVALLVVTILLGLYFGARST